MSDGGRHAARVVTLVGALALACTALEAQRAPTPIVTLAIEHGTVLPMDRDKALADHTVLVAGDRVVWVGPAREARVSEGVRRVDARGLYVVPALADMHVHVESAEQLAEYLRAGIAVVRQMNGRPQHVVWRNRVARGDLDGPRIYTAGPAIRRPPHPWGPPVPRTPAEARAIVEAQRRAGYDVLKVQSGIDSAVFVQLVASAREARLPVVGHLLEEVGAAGALAAGQASFEHLGPALFEGDDEGAGMLARARAYGAASAWIGTLVAPYDGACRPPDARRRAMVLALHRAGARLLAGTDAGIGALAHGTALHCELETLVGAGLTRYEALATATRNAGAFAREVLGDTVPFGTVTVGSRAELLVVAGDPRRDVGALRRMRGMVVRGVWRAR